MEAGLNTFVVTVTENVTITNPYYLLRIVHDQTKKEFACLVVDSSVYPARYNRFEVTQQTSPDPLQAEINVTETGTFHYYIYEQSSPTNLNYTNAAGLLEVGKLTFPRAAQTNTTYTGYSVENTVYEG